MNKLNAQTILLIVPFAYILYWVVGQFETSLNSDHAWLIEAAKRLLDGQAMSEGYYDPNPPLSILLYVPSVLMQKYMLIPEFYSYYIFTSILVIAFSAALYKIPTVFPSINQNTRLVIVFSFLCANSLLTVSGNLYFGERDQFIFIGLLCCILIQILITQNKHLELPALMRGSILTVSSIFILLKPHYLIIPAAIIIHRMITQRRLFSIFKSSDVIILTTVSVVYAAIIGVFFTDYLTEILPAFLEYYISVDNPKAPRIAFIYISLIIALAITMMMSGVPLAKLKHAYMALGLSFICGLLFWVQMKGIYYQLFPCLGFGFIGLGLFINTAIEYYFPKFKYRATASLYTVLGIAMLFSSSPQTALSHNGYSNTPLYKTIEACTADCSFFLSMENMDTIHQLALYSGATHASRFPALWWLPEVIKRNDPTAEQKYINYVVTDLKKHQPDFIIVSNNLELSGRKNFNLIAYLSSSDTMRLFMQNYTKTEILNDNRNNYMRIKMPSNDFDINFDVYKRTE